VGQTGIRPQGRRPRRRIATDVANIKRLTRAGRECVADTKTIDSNTADELVRIFDLIDRTIDDDKGPRARNTQASAGSG
jgi:hypothetical protein